MRKELLKRTLTRFALTLTVPAILLTTGHVKADGLSAASRDMLIQKLTQVYLNIAPSDSSKVGVTLRLADLHAERARLQSMDELNNGCTVCNAGKEDRKKALRYYQEALPKVADDSIGKILAQVGHLYELTGQEAQAVATYNRIIQEHRSAAAVDEAHLSLGEVYFKKRNYAQAKPHFEAVMAGSASASKGLAAYRLAWCYLNQSQPEKGVELLTHILSTPELLSRSAASGVIVADRQFQEEVSRDLATFMARRSSSAKDAAALFTLSPESTRLQNLAYLANELERVGQNPAAIATWRFAEEKQSSPEARLESRIHLAQLEMALQKRADAGKDFDAAIQLMTSLKSCESSSCQELKTRMRKFVTDWNAAEKKSPSEELLTAYSQYISAFPNEPDMKLWAAQVARSLKKWNIAYDYLLQGTQALAQTTKAGAKAEDKKKLESSLLSLIEVAELAKENKVENSSAMLAQAYDSYLQLSPEKSKALDVQYQKAHIVYEKGDYETAANSMREVALTKDLAKDAVQIRKQAADLALDSLVLLKRDQQLEAWAKDFSATFPDKKAEYQTLIRKSILNQTAAIGTNDQALTTLGRMDLSQASDEEKATYYKNKAILAEKLQKFAEARDAIDQLLRLPKLTEADRQFALTRKAYLSELVLDFASALNATEKIQQADLSPSQKSLKLALFADLAQKDASGFYSNYLKLAPASEKPQVLAVAARLVRENANPAAEIEKYKTTLAQDPELLARLYLEAYAAHPSDAYLAKILAQPKMINTQAGHELWRTSFLNEFDKLKATASSQKLQSNTQKAMAASLKARVKTIEQLEKFSQKAVDQSDWTAQLLSLNLLAVESDRLYQDILSLPVPAGLSAEEEQQYLSLISQQASPYQVKAADIRKKLPEFWSNEKALATLKDDYLAQTGAIRKLLEREVKTVSEIAPDATKAQLVAALNTPEVKPTQALVTSALEDARKELRNDPLNRSKLEGLLQIEKKVGRPAMVSYLETRLQNLSLSPSSTKNESEKGKE
jgi:hypothetical protein